MRVYQFITLFLALGVACGCSHRRAHQQSAVATLCDCSTCRCEQQRLASTGAIPADHFQDTRMDSATNLPAANAPSLTPSAATQPQPSDFSPEYASDPGSNVVSDSPFSSGNPINMDEPPQLFNMPVVDEIESAPDQIPNNMLDLTPGPGSLTPLGQDNAFQPFDRDIFKIKTESSKPLPPSQQPSILINKVSEANQLDLGSVDRPATSEFQLSLSEPISNDFEISNSNFSAPAAIEPKQLEIIEPQIDTPEPQANSFEQAASLAMPDFASNVRNFTPAPIQPSETVIEGELYEDPIVLYARPRRGQLIPSPVHTPRAVQPASVQKPVEHQGIVQDSQLDPVYGLPLSNQVQFNSLPAIAEPQLAPTPVEAQHLHVHIHHEYGGNPAVTQGPVAYQNGQPASNVQVVYRDDTGRVIMAPPTPTTGVAAAVPTGDQRTYYIPPKQILRLKAVSPIDLPRSNPSVASIQMRDTVVHGGTHLLTKPEHQAQAVQINHGLPGIDHEKLREAFKTSPTGNSLR